MDCGDGLGKSRKRVTPSHNESQEVFTLRGGGGGGVREKKGDGTKKEKDGQEEN